MKWFFLVIIAISLFSCKKEKVYKLSDDICVACNQNPIHVIGNDTIWIPQVFTPNWDGSNDIFGIRGLEKFSNNTIVFYNRNMDQLAQYSPYSKPWSGRADNSQDVPLNGLYHYKLTIGTSVFEGSILILSQRDDYFDIKISNNACSAGCIKSLYIDPILFDE